MTIDGCLRFGVDGALRGGERGFAVRNARGIGFGVVSSSAWEAVQTRWQGAPRRARGRHGGRFGSASSWGVSVTSRDITVAELFVYCGGIHILQELVSCCIGCDQGKFDEMCHGVRTVGIFLSFHDSNRVALEFQCSCETSFNETGSGIDPVDDHSTPPPAQFLQLLSISTGRSIRPRFSRHCSVPMIDT
jgi:hypothetical protein